jgi:16S rRNA (cytosine1402-N4)-methyltransferase
MRGAAVAESIPSHRPALLAETMAALAPASGKVLLDGTVGQGGHAEAWLVATAPFGRVIGLDRDPGALAFARSRLAPFGARAHLLHADFREAPALLDEERLPAPDAVLLDLGVGSHQLDDAARGFSFRFDGPLDMRFDTTAPGPTAADLLAHAPAPELARIFAEFGEQKAAKKLARVICETRRRAPLRTTGDLARLVRGLLPAGGRRRIDPATLVFQALRIAVNRELDGLDDAIVELVRRLPVGGRLAVIAFHSLEDRIAKRTLRRLAEPCHCRRGDPCTCGALELLELPSRRAVMTTDEEVVLNPRARSARLRYGVRR